LVDPRGYNLVTYTHFPHPVIEHLALPEVTLLGHSHGGFVAQRCALDHPDRVTSLILYDAPPVTGDDYFHDYWGEGPVFDVREELPAITCPCGRGQGYARYAPETRA
jgi:pimeloyl-ACP methyl ester carboxylesterase